MSPAGVPSTYTETPSGIYNVYRLLHAAEVRSTVYDLIIVSLKSNPGEKNVLYILYVYTILLLYSKTGEDRRAALGLVQNGRFGTNRNV